MAHHVYEKANMFNETYFFYTIYKKSCTFNYSASINQYWYEYSNKNVISKFTLFQITQEQEYNGQFFFKNVYVFENLFKTWYSRKIKKIHFIWYLT